MDSIVAFIIQFLESLNYRLRGAKCPYCGREVRVASMRLGCCRRVVGLETHEKRQG